MSWSLVIPSSMLALGAWLLLFSIPLQLLTPHNSKAACWCALLGGFGVGGAAGGWVGSVLVNTGNTVVSTTERLTAQAVGAGFGVLAFAILAILFWRVAGKQGTGLKAGQGKTGKFKQVAWLAGFALLGCAVAGLPEVYGVADSAVNMAGSALMSALP